MTQITVREAASILGCGEVNIYDRVRVGAIRAASEKPLMITVSEIVRYRNDHSDPHYPHHHANKGKPWSEARREAHKGAPKLVEALTATERNAIINLSQRCPNLSFRQIAKQVMDSGQVDTVSHQTVAHIISDDRNGIVRRNGRPPTKGTAA
jgi:hypothetical protein